MTVVIHFQGGPLDGGYRRLSSWGPFVTAEKLIVVCRPRGYYTSIDPWDGESCHVDLLWFYGAPEGHEAMKQAGN